MGKCHSHTTVTTYELPPIDLGSGVRIDTPVILAPMSGVTDLPFRRLAKQLGAGMVVSEMIASWAMIRENQKTLAMAEMDGAGGVSALQLAGCDPDAMAEAARIAEGRGADLIDINFGCPVKKVALGQMAGSALMRDAAAAERILAATVRAVKVPVTLALYCAHCGGALTLQFDSWPEPTTSTTCLERQIWLCSFCGTENAACFPAALLWVTPGHGTSRVS